ncbi:MAG: hypothetical protein LBL07_00455 [Tannerella sp.]|nr:hypothetical protein [Tannerella sp.]
MDEFRDKLAGLDMDALCFEIATSLNGDIRHRVHVDGLAADGSKIGTYSKGYMKVRSGNYDDAERFKRDSKKTGKKAGDFKDKKKKGGAGVFTKGPRKGQPRPVYNRKDEKDVVLSLTRQMENDMKNTGNIPVEGGYGIGYSNEHNYNKAMWVEETYDKKIWDFTEKEKQTAIDIVNRKVDEISA